MQPFILQLLSQYRYFIVIPITIVEGPLIMLACGFLVRMGMFDPIPIYFALMFADFLGDVMWYCIGYFWGPGFIDRFGKYVNINSQTIHKVERIFHKFHTRILFISKITMGFGFALVTLFTAGLIKIPFKRYAYLNITGGFVWTGLLLTVGYYLGELYSKANKGLEYVTLGAGVVIVLALGYGFGQYWKNRFNRE